MTDSRRPASRALATLAAALCLALAAGCGDDAPEDPVLATVDGLDLTRDDFLRSYVDYLVTTGQNDTEALRQRHFDALVDAYLLGAEAERRGLATDSALQAAQEMARRRLLGAAYYESTVLDTLAAPTDAEVRTAYRLGSEQRVVRQLFYTNEDSARAAYARLRAGRPFLEEAWDLYGTRDSTAGLLGAVSYWQLDDAFAEAAFTTPVGEVAPPVRSRMGLHIVYVEDVLRNPLLAEDEFLRRRKGVESQFRLRRRRLEGDAFIRDFMEARHVAMNRPALVALVQAIDEMEGEPLPDAQQAEPGDKRFTPGQTAEILGAFRPETPLATFEVDGQPQTFTLADYVFWLPMLPPSEARDRTGASVGRALRNEALARAGEAAGVAERPEVVAELDRMRRLGLADALRQRLRAEAAPADSARLAAVAGWLQVEPRQTVATFWAVPFADRAAAEAALSRLRSPAVRAAAQPGYESFEATPLSAVEAYASAVRAAPLGQPVLASVGESWAVISVSDRRTEVTGSGADALAPFVAEADLVRRLRAERPVVIHEGRLADALRPPPVPQDRR